MEFYPARQIFLPIECLFYKMTLLPALYDSIDTMAASNKQTLAPARQGKAWHGISPNVCANTHCPISSLANCSNE